MKSIFFVVAFLVAATQAGPLKDGKKIKIITYFTIELIEVL